MFAPLLAFIVTVAVAVLLGLLPWTSPLVMLAALAAAVLASGTGMAWLDHHGWLR